MRRVLVGSIPLAVALLLAVPRTARSQTLNPAEPVIVAHGESILMLPSDRAYVQIGAEGHAAKPADAQRIAAAAMTSVQAALKAIGITAEMLKTTTYSLQPQYDYNGGRTTFREYLARNVIEVRVDDLTQLAGVLDSAGTSGAASVNGLRFDLKNRGAAELDALHRAVRDANERATAIAEGAGKTLGPIVRLEEERISAATPVFRMQLGSAAAARGAETPIDPGEIQVRAQVTLTVAIR